MANKSYLNIQVLRAIAAILVAFYHLQPMLRSPETHGFNSHFGAFGVDIFFVISGFVMYVSNDGADRTLSPFLIERILRIVPMYWFATIIMVLFYYMGYQPNGLMHFEPYMLFQSAFFITTIFSDDRYDLILSLGWTLTYELFFYSIFAFGLFFGSSARSFLFVSVAFMAAIMTGVIFPDLPIRLGFFTNPIILEFLLGGVIALVVLRWDSRRIILPRRAAALAAVAIVVGVVFVIFTDVSMHWEPDRALRAFVWGPAAFLIVGGLVILERCGARVRSRTLVLLGSASYALYLFHPIVMQGVLKVTGGIFSFDGFYGAGMEISIALGCALLAAILVHKTVEAGMLNLSKSIVRELRASGNRRDVVRRRDDGVADPDPDPFPSRHGRYGSVPGSPAVSGSIWKVRG